MNIKQAKEYQSLGVIVGFDAIRDPDGGGWLLIVTGQNERKWTLQTALGRDKVFSKLDTLVQEVESIAGSIASLHANF